MTKTLFSGKNFDKGAEVHYLFNGTVVNHSDFRIARNTLNNGAGTLYVGGAVFAVNSYGAVVFGVDRYIVFFGNGLNVLAAGPD